MPRLQCQMSATRRKREAPLIGRGSSGANTPSVDESCVFEDWQGVDFPAMGDE